MLNELGPIVVNRPVLDDVVLGTFRIPTRVLIVTHEVDCSLTREDSVALSVVLFMDRDRKVLVNFGAKSERRTEAEPW